MGQAAAEHADDRFVTDDNPRSEVPAAIRAEILQACPEAIEVGDRAEAILRGVDALEPGDALLIAGKGHETGQIVGDVVYPFDDVEQASVAVAALDGRSRMTALWTAAEAAAATGGQVAGDWTATGISIDSRSVAPGDLFVALSAARDGHDFVADALARGLGRHWSRIPEGVDPMRAADRGRCDGGAAQDLGRAGGRARRRV
jgi:UDP-N-acetylmuramyl tripeptide synthase